MTDWSSCGSGNAEGPRQHRPDLDGRPGVGPGHHDAEVLALVGQGLTGERATEDLAHLEQGGAVGAVRLVVGHRLEQPRPQRGAQDRLLGGQGVGQGDGIGGQAAPGEIAGGQEGQRHGLVEAEADEDLSEATTIPLTGGEAAGLGRPRDTGRDAAVAVVAGDLLDDVGLGGRVGSERRHGDGVQRGGAPTAVGRQHGGGRIVADVLDAEADGREVAGDLLAREGRAQQCVHPALAHGDGCAVGQPAVDGDPSCHQARPRRGQQLGEAASGQVDDLGIGAPLEAGRRLGTQAEVLGGAGHGHGLPPGAFEQDRGGALGDLGGGAAHHPGDAHRHVVGVADHAVAPADEGALDTVEGRDRLAVAGPSHPQRALRHRGGVVGVVGLAQLEHDVVGGVDHVVDGSHPERGEPIGDPAGRRLDADPLEDADVEAPAQVRVVDLDGRV